MIWSPRFWTLMIWVYLNEGSRNGFEATKRKKTWTCLFVSNSSLLAAQMATLPKTNSLPLKMGRKPQRKGSSPNHQFSGMVITPESQDDFAVILVGHEWWARYQPQVGMGSTFWELSCSFSIFFPVEFSNISTKKETIVCFTTKNNVLENQKQFNMKLPATKFRPMFWTNCEWAVLGANVTTFWPEDYGQIEGLGSWEVQRRHRKNGGMRWKRCDCFF